MSVEQDQELVVAQAVRKRVAQRHFGDGGRPLPSAEH
jgi:hypothetical protein